MKKLWKKGDSFDDENPKDNDKKRAEQKIRVRYHLRDINSELRAISES